MPVDIILKDSKTDGTEVMMTSRRAHWHKISFLQLNQTNPTHPRTNFTNICWQL